MRRALGTLLVVTLVGLLPSPGLQAGPVDGPLMHNVDVLATFPEVTAIGGKFQTVNDRPYFISTGLGGVFAYDVTNPELPILAGFLPLPHFENEDVDMNDEILLVSLDTVTFDAAGLYIIDISQLPLMTFAYERPITANAYTWGSYQGGHTISCILDCDYALSVGDGSRVHLIDLRDPSAPRVEWHRPSPVGSTHDVQTDETGVSWLVGSGGFAGWRFTPENVENPELVVRHNPDTIAYHHNSWRPNAAAYVPGQGDPAAPRLDRGEVILLTEEEIFSSCANQGQFATASLVGMEGAEEDGTAPESVRVLDRWTTELKTPDNVGDPLTGNQPAAGVCSSHYFDERDGIVAVGWYQQGVRFLDVTDPTDIKQVGYFVAPDSATWAAYWATDDIVYTVDASRGLTVLRFNGEPGQEEDVDVAVPPLWLAAAPGELSFAPHPTWGYACAIPA